jgi:cystinosin
LIFQRGHQTVSRLCKLIILAIGLFLGISLIVSIASVLKWIDFLYFCSYVKLFITLIKYMPQGYMNFRRKSTMGWSIGNVLLDFTGGTLSIAQMFIQSYNNSELVLHYCFIWNTSFLHLFRYMCMHFIVKISN